MVLFEKGKKGEGSFREKKGEKRVMRKVEYAKHFKEGGRGFINEIVDKAIEDVSSVIKYQQKKGLRKSAHDLVHVLGVAKAAGEYVLHEEDNGRLVGLAAFAGLLHDLIRYPHEVEGYSDGYLTADVLRVMKRMADVHKNGINRVLVVVELNGEKGIYRIKDVDKYMSVKEEIEGVVGVVGDEIVVRKKNGEHVFFEVEKVSGKESVYYSAAVEVSENMPNLLSLLKEIDREDVELLCSVIERNEKEVSEILSELGEVKKDEKILQEALLYGDKLIEGMGPRVVVRRAQFVSGERYWTGDLKGLGDKVFEVAGIDEEDVKREGYTKDDVGMISAFVFESIRRIYSQKALKDFPEDGLWKKKYTLRKFELEVFEKAALWLLDKLEKWSKREEFKKEKGGVKLLWLAKEVKFPKITDKNYDKIKKGIVENFNNKYFGEYKEMNEEESNTFSKEDVVHWILGTAYEETVDVHGCKDCGKKHIEKVNSEDLKNLTSSFVDVEKLKTLVRDFLVRYFEDSEKI